MREDLQYNLNVLRSQRVRHESCRPRIAQGHQLPPPRASFVCHGLHAATSFERRLQAVGRVVVDLLRKGNCNWCRSRIIVSVL